MNCRMACPGGTTRSPRPGPSRRSGKRASASGPDECCICEASDPYLYIRTTPEGRVICGGEDEEFSDAERRDALLGRKTATLRRKLHRLLPKLDTTVEFAWTGAFGETDYRPADHRTGSADAALLDRAWLRRQRHDLCRSSRPMSSSGRSLAAPTWMPTSMIFRRTAGRIDRADSLAGTIAPRSGCHQRFGLEPHEIYARPALCKRGWP